MKAKDLKRIELDLAVNDKGGFFLAKEIPFIVIKNIFFFIKRDHDFITDIMYSKELLRDYNYRSDIDKKSDEKNTSFFGTNYNYLNYRKIVDKMRGKYNNDIEKSFKDDFNKLLIGELGFIEFSKRNIFEFDISEFSVIDVILIVFILKETGLIINPKNYKNHVKLSIDINDTLDGFFLNKKIPLSEIRKVFSSVLNLSIDDFIYNEERLDRERMFGNEVPKDLLKRIYLSEELFEQGFNSFIYGSSSMFSFLTENVYQFEKLDISSSNWIKIFNCFKEDGFLCDRNGTNGFSIILNPTSKTLRYEAIYKRNGKNEEVCLNERCIEIINNIELPELEIDIDAVDPDISGIKIINKFLGVTNKTKKVGGKIFYRTKFVNNYTNKKYKCIKANCGDLGGWIENPRSLDYTSVVMGEAEVSSDSSLHNWSVAMNNVKISGKGLFYGSIILNNSNISNDSNSEYEINNSTIFENAKINNGVHIANCRIYGNAKVSDRVKLREIEIYENAIIKGNVNLDTKANWNEDLFFKVHGNAKLISEGKKDIRINISRADIYGDVQIKEGSIVDGCGQLLLAGYKIITLNITDFNREYDYTYLIDVESKEKPYTLKIE